METKKPVTKIETLLNRKSNIVLVRVKPLGEINESGANEDSAPRKMVFSVIMVTAITNDSEIKKANGIKVELLNGEEESLGVAYIDGDEIKNLGQKIGHTIKYFNANASSSEGFAMEIAYSTKDNFRIGLTKSSTDKDAACYSEISNKGDARLNLQSHEELINLRALIKKGFDALKEEVME